MMVWTASTLSHIRTRQNAVGDRVLFTRRLKLKSFSPSSTTKVGYRVRVNKSEKKQKQLFSPKKKKTTTGCAETVIRFTLRPVGVYHFYCRHIFFAAYYETRAAIAGLVRTKGLTTFAPAHRRLKKIHRWIIVIRASGINSYRCEPRARVRRAISNPSPVPSAPRPPTHPSRNSGVPWCPRPADHGTPRDGSGDVSWPRPSVTVVLDSVRDSTARCRNIMYYVRKRNTGNPSGSHVEVSAIHTRLPTRRCAG